MNIFNSKCPKLYSCTAILVHMRLFGQPVMNEGN